MECVGETFPCYSTGGCWVNLNGGTGVKVVGGVMSFGVWRIDDVNGAEVRSEYE